jgi:hypothetical protein
MKTLKTTLVLSLIVLCSSVTTFAQVKGNGNITKQERQLGTFDAINVGCAINLFLSQGSTQSVAVETDENLVDRINTKISNGVLQLSCDNVRNATKMNVYVTAVKLTKLEASGASVVKGVTPIKADQFSLIASGASKVNMELNAQSIYNDVSGASKESLAITASDLKSEISGASNVKYTGSATEHKTEVSGAGNLKALEFVTDNTNAEVSGAGNASVMAKKQLKADLSGAGTITYFDNSEVKKIGKAGEYQLSFNGMDNVKSVTVEEEGEVDESHAEGSDTIMAKTDDNGNVEVRLNNNRIVIVTDDSVKVKLGNNTIEVDDDGDVKVKHDKKKQKFNGHWKGLELGVNGFMTENNDFEYGSEYNLLDQKYQKSINVNLNFFEQNVNLIRNRLGLVTGLGLTWNNYRFDDNVRLAKENNRLALSTVNAEGTTYEKSKLVNTYLTLPLMLEVQSNRYSKANSFHLSGGVVGGWRIGTHAKYVYDDGSRQKDKDRSDFYMNPFKVDAIAKVGWGVLNLYATYSLTPMFQDNKGPKLYPFSIGICLTDLSDL